MDGVSEQLGSVKENVNKDDNYIKNQKKTLGIYNEERVFREFNTQRTHWKQKKKAERIEGVNYLSSLCEWVI